jgi:type II secretory pathway component PulM
MTGALDYLGVKPQERRSVIFLLIGFFVVGNVVWLFMGPELIELRKSRDDLLGKNKLLAGVETRLKDVKTELKTLRGLEDAKFVSSSEAAQKLMNMVETKARRSGLNITRTRGSQGSGRGNKEFDEYKRTISFQSGMIELVDFLKNVSEEQSMIRVSDMKILPTPDRRYLKVDLTFIASFPKAEIESKPSKKGKKK